MSIHALLSEVFSAFVVKRAPNCLEMEHVEVYVFLHQMEDVNAQLIIRVCKGAEVAEIAVYRRQGVLMTCDAWLEGQELTNPHKFWTYLSYDSSSIQVHYCCGTDSKPYSTWFCTSQGDTAPRLDCEPWGRDPSRNNASRHVHTALRCRCRVVGGGLIHGSIYSALGCVI